MSNWIMCKTPYVSKRTGTVVRTFEDKVNRGLTMRQVSPGPRAQHAKYSKIEVVRDNGKLISMTADDVSLGMHQKVNMLKQKKGWKRIFSAFKAL